MQIANLLSNADKRKIDKIRSNMDKQHDQTKQKYEERIDWNDIMGCNNRGLRRGKGGAFKRR
ncbi:hypothetical protein ACFSO7_02865 [Bacillus sp. CGMCC 1.16607]|uniref:hypothetical protein n=1 Tax=Bacillus sp. CGMCC 1.16607 TaxID=3351842 RepID=UPI0036321A6A